MAATPLGHTWGSARFYAAACNMLGVMNTDLELIVSIRNMLWLDGHCRGNDIQVRARDGCVTLSGDVEWEFLRCAALCAIRDLPGIARVVDDLVVTAAQPQSAASRAPDPAPPRPDPVSRSRWS